MIPGCRTMRRPLLRYQHPTKKNAEAGVPSAAPVAASTAAPLATEHPPVHLLSQLLPPAAHTSPIRWCSPKIQRAPCCRYSSGRTPADPQQQYQRLWLQQSTSPAAASDSTNAYAANLAVPRTCCHKRRVEKVLSSF
jgi:hypothetical protein